MTPAENGGTTIFYFFGRQIISALWNEYEAAGRVVSFGHSMHTYIYFRFGIFHFVFVDMST